MDLLLTFILPAVLFLALEFFWCRPSWLRASSDALRAFGAPQRLADEDPFAWSFVRNRMDVLAAELERLENDTSIFAKAFRTHVAQAAYQALIADAARLANESRLAAISPSPDVTIVEMEMLNSLPPLREELEV
jgi:hypothetical protein